MNDELNSTISDIISRLVPLFKPFKIILFGSHAWGQPGTSSDLDLLVVIDRSVLSPSHRAAKAYLSLRGIKMPIEVIVSTRKELERFGKVRGSLTRKILEKGRVLYG
mgnify:CR=1 FL=1